MLLCLAFLSQGGAVGQESESALRSGAVSATKELGSEVVKGNFSFTIQKMYPRWKKQAAADVGGMDKLVKILTQVPRQMKQNGIAILAFEPGVPRKVFEVQAAVVDLDARQAAKLGVKPGKQMIYTEWLVFVPTKMKYLVPDPETGKNVRLEKSGFQVAVTRKEENNWTFIDGSNLKIEELRRLFPALPATKDGLMLPKVSGFTRVAK